MIHVIATIELTPGSRPAFMAEMAKLVPLVQAEAGCIEYGAAIDVESGLAVQPALRDDVVTVVEKWADVPALQAHLIAPHMADYRTRVKAYVVSTKLHVLQPAAN